MKAPKTANRDNAEASQDTALTKNPSTRATDLDPLWSAARISQFLEINISTLHRWVSGGRFPEGFWLNGVRRWRESVVMKFTDSNERKAYQYAQLQ